MRTRLPLAACLLALALPAATSVAKDKPVVETRTYQVQMILSGTYTQTVDEAGEGAGYCPGTGQVSSAQFAVDEAARLRVKLDTDTATGKKTGSFGDDTANHWNITLVTNTDDNDCSAPNETLKCEGDVRLQPNPPATNFATAVGIGHRFAFGISLVGPPTPILEPDDCQKDIPNGVSPPPGSAGLAEAVAPWTSGAYRLQLTKLNDLKRGHTLKKTFAPEKGMKGKSYDVATCNHSAGNNCTGKLDDFVHTISIKRLK